MFRKSVFALSLLSLCACADFQRSGGSGYANQTPHIVTTSGTNEAVTPNDPDTTRTAYELGMNPSNLSSDDWHAIELRKRLRGLEKSLDTKQEKEQYSKVLPWLKDDEEKIDLLSIPSLEGRQSWINRNNVWSRSRVPVAHMKELVESQDISIGMPMEFVRKSWGDPVSVEVSGNPIYKNERWRYIRNVPSSDGFRQEKRFVYFEGGRVVGWDTE